MTAHAGQTGRGVALAAAILALAAGVAITFATSAPEDAALLPSLSDEVLLYPLALKSVDPGLYSGDEYLAKAEQVFSRVYSLAVGPVLARAEDPLAVDHGLSMLACAIFLSGALLLGARWLGTGWGGLLLGGLWLVPWIRAYGVGPGDSLPRDFLFAALPWLLVLLPRAESRRWRFAALGLLLGALTNLHPLTGAHLALLIGATVLLSGDVRRTGWKNALAFSAGWLAGAAPYVLSFLALPRGGIAPPSVTGNRVPRMAGMKSYEIARMWGPVLAIAAAPAIAHLPGVLRKRSLALLFTICGVVGVLGSGVVELPPVLAQFQLMRLSKVFGFLGLIAAGGAVLAAVRSRRRVWIATALVSIALLSLLPVQSRLFERSARRLLGRPPPRQKVAPKRPRGTNLAARSQDARRSFLEVTRWCRAETPRDAVFLVPPEEFAPFRLYARRSVVVTRKEGGFAVTFLGEEGGRWADLYRRVSAAYARSDTAEVLALARERHADFVLAELPWNPLDLPVAFRSGPFVVHRAPGAD